MQTAINAGFYGQAIIAMLMITLPPDPVKVLFFNSIIEKSGKNRFRASLQVAITVGVILGGSVFIGKALLD
ncbi:MAG: MarC family protein, partial [Acidimicrobiia bacterium]